MLNFTRGMTTFFVLITLGSFPATADTTSLQELLDPDTNASLSAAVERLFNENERVTLDVQFNKLVDAGAEPEEILPYLLNCKMNPGEAPTFDRVVSAVANLKAAGIPQAQILSKADAQAKVEDRAELEGMQKQKEIETEKNFLGVDWSLGIALSVDLGGEKRVKQEGAKVVNGMVRVDEESSANLGLFWELHKYWWNNKGKCLNRSNDTNCNPTDPTQAYQFATKGWGPFIGLTTSQEDLIESFSAGLMYGRRTSEDQKVGLNFGLGLTYQPGVQVLGDGIVANQPLPDGETEIRFKKEDRWGALVAVSFRF